MKQFRKKPVIIEAVQLTDKNILTCYELVNNTTIELLTNIDHDKFDDFKNSVIKNGLTIPTLEDGKDKRAKHVASIGDWIIKGVKGEFYACKPDIFDLTYEAVN